MWGELNFVDRMSWGFFYLGVLLVYRRSFIPGGGHPEDSFLCIFTTTESICGVGCLTGQDWCQIVCCGRSCFWTPTMLPLRTRRSCLVVKSSRKRGLCCGRTIGCLLLPQTWPGSWRSRLFLGAHSRVVRWFSTNNGGLPPSSQVRIHFSLTPAGLLISPCKHRALG